VDDSSIVFVADPTFGDILNFNVGQAVDLEVPRVSSQEGGSRLPTGTDLLRFWFCQNPLANPTRKH
jgi:hypothetical protein